MASIPITPQTLGLALGVAFAAWLVFRLAVGAAKQAVAVPVALALGAAVLLAQVHPALALGVAFLAYVYVGRAVETSLRLVSGLVLLLVVAGAIHLHLQGKLPF